MTGLRGDPCRPYRFPGVRTPGYNMSSLRDWGELKGAEKGTGVVFLHSRL